MWDDIFSPWNTIGGERMPTKGRFAAPPAVAPVPGAPTTGQGPFGMVPGPVDLPDMHQKVGGVIPGLDDSLGQASGNVLAHLRGQLSPATQAALHDMGARFGISSGMPGAQLGQYRTARDLGRATEDLQSAGLQGLGSLIGYGKELVPSDELQYQNSVRNSELAAAPDPGQQASYAKQLFDQYLASLAQGGRSPGGGTGQYTSPQQGTGTYKGPHADDYDRWLYGDHPQMTGEDAEHWKDPNWDATEEGWQYAGPTGSLPDWTLPGWTPPVAGVDEGMPVLPGQNYGPWDEDWWNA